MEEGLIQRYKLLHPLFLRELGRFAHPLVARDEEAVGGVEEGVVSAVS